MITIRIETDNSAFEGNPFWEVSRILHDLATKLADDSPKPVTIILRDINGNKTGTCKIT